LLASLAVADLLVAPCVCASHLLLMPSSPPVFLEGLGIVSFNGYRVRTHSLLSRLCRATTDDHARNAHKP